MTNDVIDLAVSYRVGEESQVAAHLYREYPKARESLGRLAAAIVHEHEAGANRIVVVAEVAKDRLPDVVRGLGR